MDDTEFTRYKRCFKCGALLPLSCFHKDNSRRDGYCNKCKNCKNRYNDKYRRDNEDKIKEYRERYKSCGYYDEYRKTEQGRDSFNKAGKKWRFNNKKKYRAGWLVKYAIKCGKLIRKPCEVCGRSDRVHAHHCDYDKPLDVMWLCHLCHRAWHHEHGEGANAHDEVIIDG